MADHAVSAVLRSSSTTGGLAGANYAAGSRIKGPTPPELRPQQTKFLPSGEEIVILRPVRR